MYTPSPVDVSSVRLPDQLTDLTEQLAKNAHDVWATKRMREGWVLGPVRDDIRKEHPCLVPYEDLPESEKIYDREMALASVKMIITLGYRIAKTEPPSESDQNDTSLRNSLRQLVCGWKEYAGKTRLHGYSDSACAFEDAAEELEKRLGDT